MNNEQTQKNAIEADAFDDAHAAKGDFANVVPFDEMSDAERLVVSLDGYEGPLDLLLSLARTQKVDISKISILKLAEQYLAFIAQARSLRLEIAADYLVTAAWLAFLKSKLLLPAEEKQEGGMSGEEMALHLAFRLKRLDAMRDAVARLFGRKRLGVDYFGRGMPEGIRTVRKSEYWASVYDLLKAYAEQRGKNAVVPVKIGGRQVWSIRDARDYLEKLFGQSANWSILESYIKDYLRDAGMSKTALASSFSATLELSREGLVEIRQAQPFAPIYVRWLKQDASQNRPGDPKLAS
jgi:segregation and condensation protein A